MLIYPEQAELRKLFDYNPATGQFTWKMRRGGIKRGAEAGMYHDGSQCWVVTVSGQRYSKARLIWIYVYGSIPEGHELTHDNRDKSDFRLSNLLCITRGDNELRNEKRWERAKWEWSEKCAGRTQRRKRRK